MRIFFLLPRKGYFYFRVTKYRVAYECLLPWGRAYHWAYLRDLRMWAS